MLASTRRATPHPVHYESLRPPAALRAAVWTVSILLAGAGMAVSVLYPRAAVATVAAGLALTLGALGLFTALRLGRIEVVVTRQTLRVDAGPLTRTAPVWGIQETVLRPATSWRRLYAHEEAVLRLDPLGGRQFLAVPTADGEGLQAALRHS